MLERIYIEIGNICNLNCSFCGGTVKPKKQMSIKEFALICEKIKNKTKFIYLHIMGEPLLHKDLNNILKIAKENELPVCITTNGTLLKEKGEILLKNDNCVHKVSISLHAPEGNDITDFNDYLETAVSFSKSAAQKGIFTVFRLWNKDSAEGIGKNTQNQYIETFLKTKFMEEWQVRPRGYRLDKNVFLEFDGVFTWPSSSNAESVTKGFCHGLSSQLGILADGTVVPCCLDSNGEIELGNIFESSLEEILNEKRATDIKQNFAKGEIFEPLCQKCTFARKFKIRNN